MDANDCYNHVDGNHFDADVLLPPRKRLLAGYKKQSSDSPSPSPSPSSCSQENSSCTQFGQFDARLSNLLRTYKNGSNLSPEEISKAAGIAAAASSKAAQAARAAAEEKATIAAKAVAAAKSALQLVASINGESGGKEKHQKKNKLKKHLPVQLLYKKYQPVESCLEDEELARRLHQAMNNSSRISRHGPSSDLSNTKRKKLKTSPTYGKIRVPNGASSSERKLPYESDDDGEMDSESS